MKSRLNTSSLHYLQNLSTYTPQLSCLFSNTTDGQWNCLHLKLPENSRRRARAEPTLYVRCETKKKNWGSSGWYKINDKWEFEETDHNYTIENQESPTNDIDISLGNTGHPLPLTTVYAAAGGAAALVIILLTLLALLLRKVNKQRKEIELSKDEIDEFMQGVAAEKAKAKGINGLFVLSYDKSLEIAKSSLNFCKPYTAL